MDPFHKRKMVGPRFALVDELLLEGSDQRPILTLDVPLALGPVGYAGALLNSELLACAPQVVAVKFATIVAS